MTGGDVSEKWFDSGPTEVLQGTMLSNIKAADYVDGRTFEVLSFTGIVLTQTCDIINKAPERLLVAQVNKFSDVYKADSNRWSDGKNLLQLADGHVVNYFLLPPSAVTGGDWAVVSYLDTFHVRRSLCEDRLASGVNLRSPYLEHFAQGFAAFMMRVALPTRIPRDAFRAYAKGLKDQ